MMLSRRNFLKGLLSGVGAVGLSPYIPNAIIPAKSVALKAASIRPFTAGERIWTGNAVYIGNDGRYYNAPGYSVVGIALNSAKKNESLFVLTHGTVVVNAIMPDESYYLKGEG